MLLRKGEEERQDSSAESRRDDFGISQKSEIGFWISQAIAMIWRDSGSSQGLFPNKNFQFPAWSAESFYKPVHSIGGDYYDFLPLKDDCCGESRSETFAAKESVPTTHG